MVNTANFSRFFRLILSGEFNRKFRITLFLWIAVASTRPHDGGADALRSQFCRTGNPSRRAAKAAQTMMAKMTPTQSIRTSRAEAVRLITND